jgi:hypothetical protein
LTPSLSSRGPHSSGSDGWTRAQSRSSAQFCRALDRQRCTCPRDGPPAWNRRRLCELSKHPRASGKPVKGHDIGAGIEIVGTRHLDLPRTGYEKLSERRRANGALLQLGWPLESQTLCRFTEVMLDVIAKSVSRREMKLAPVRKK